MATTTTATREQIRAAEELLHAAEVDLAAGKEQPGALKAWDAAVMALKMAAEPRGWPCNDKAEMRQAVEDLEKETGIKDLSLGFSTADAFHTQGAYGMMYENNIEDDVPWIQQFVTQLLDLADPGRPKKAVPPAIKNLRKAMAETRLDYFVDEPEKASAIMWQSVCAALQTLAAQRGWPGATTAEMREVAAALARETGDCRFVGGFAVAETYFANFDPDFCADDHDIFARPLVRRFVIRVLHLLDY